VADLSVKYDGYAQLVAGRLPDEPFGMHRRHRMVLDRLVTEVRSERGVAQ
jgi:hypothetical protein